MFCTNFCKYAKWGSGNKLVFFTTSQEKSWKSQVDLIRVLAMNPVVVTPLLSHSSCILYFFPKQQNTSFAVIFKKVCSSVVDAIFRQEIF